MKYFACFLFISVLFNFNLKAQSVKEKSDPKATALLNKLKKQYSSFKSMQADFSIELEVPEKPKQVNKGSLIQSGKKYRITLPDLTSFSDAKTVWTYLKKSKEIQITNYGEKENTPFISPQELISIYEKKDLLYGISGETNIEGTKCTEVEFKPTSSRTDYFKIRLTIDTKNSQVRSAKVFYKDGTRYTLTINKVQTNQVIPDSKFIYNSKEWVGIPIEDLRID